MFPNKPQQPQDFEYLVQSLREFRLEEVGSESWMNSCEAVLKLSQQAIIEANSHYSEDVKEFLVLHRKLPILVHEIYCIMIWKIKVLPLILEIERNPTATFLIYTVLFHEGTAVTLLELALFHECGCESLGETAIDLVDYCVQVITQLIGLHDVEQHEDVTNIEADETIELRRQQRNISFQIGLKCLSVLSYLVDRADKLSVVKYLATVYDIPCLLSKILHLKPWLRKTKKGFEKFIDGKWTEVKGESILQITKIEAQSWLCFRQLLFNSNIMKFYEINDFRKREIAKCQELLTEIVLDQLPPLIELKHFLGRLVLTEFNESKKLQNLLLEEIPQIKNKIIRDAKIHGGYKKIAEEQAKIFLNKEHQYISETAKRLNEIYDFDFYIKYEDNTNRQENITKEMKKCGNCQKKAEQKCSNCLITHYCSRECQVANWSEHKKVCIKMNF